MQIVLAVLSALSISVFACFFLAVFISIFVPFLSVAHGDLRVLNGGGKIVVAVTFIVLLVTIYLAIARDETIAKDFKKWRN